MTFSERLALGWQCLVRGAREWRSAALWQPWLLLGALQALVLAALAYAAHPWLAGALAGFVRAEGGDDALRYPGSFQRLPALAASAEALLGVVLAPLVLGVATLLFAAAYAGRRPALGAAWRTALGRAPALVGLSLPAQLAALLLPPAFATLGHAHVSLLTRLALPRVLAVLVTLAWAVQLLIPPAVLLGERGFAGAARTLGSALRRAFAPAVVVAACLAVPLALVRAGADRGSAWVGVLRPEGVWAMQALRVVLTLVLGFLCAGAATLVHLSIAREPDEEGW